MASGHVQEMLDGIAAAVLAGLEAGETRVHVCVNREHGVGDGAGVATEFIVVEGFACGSTTCDRPHHVRVYSGEMRYEYPDHLAHR